MPPRFPSLCQPKDWGLCDSSIPTSRRQFLYRSGLQDHTPPQKVEAEVTKRSQSSRPGGCAPPPSAPAPAVVRLMLIRSQPRTKLRVLLHAIDSSPASPTGLSSLSSPFVDGAVPVRLRWRPFRVSDAKLPNRNSVGCLFVGLWKRLLLLSFFSLCPCCSHLRFYFLR